MTLRVPFLRLLHLFQCHRRSPDRVVSQQSPPHCFYRLVCHSSRGFQYIGYLSAVKVFPVPGPLLLVSGRIRRRDRRMAYPCSNIINPFPFPLMISIDILVEILLVTSAVISTFVSSSKARLSKASLFHRTGDILSTSKLTTIFC